MIEAKQRNMTAYVISIDPQEQKNMEELQKMFDDGYKLLSASSAHDRIVYVFLSPN
jgi:hypothetical protein